MKISTQVILSYFLIVGLAAYFFLSVFVQDIKPGVTHSVEDSLIDTSNILAELATPDLRDGHINDGAFAAAVRHYGERRVDALIAGVDKSSLDYRVYVTNAQGMVVFDSANRNLGADFSRWNDVYLSLRGKYGARSTASDPSNRDTAVMHVAAPILDDGRIIGVLTVAKADSSIAPFIERAEATVRRQGAALLIAAALIGIFFAWRLTRSIERLRRYAKAVAGGSRTPLPSTMNREIAELGKALEGMREKLDGKEYVEQYVHALTHELKSPVAAIRGAAELLGEENIALADRTRFAANIREQSERIQIIAERLLELAKVEHLHALTTLSAVDLDALVESLVDDLEPRLLQRGLTCRVEGIAAVVPGDPFLLAQAISNLLENAIDFAPAGSHILVRFAVDAAMVSIEVIDRGPGIPPYAQTRIFERFYSLARPGSDKKSTGLGLPLVREIAKLHGGSIALDNLPEGGTVARLRLARA